MELIAVALKQSTVRIPEELYESLRQFEQPFNEIVIDALELYIRAKKRENAIRMAAELREELRRRSAEPADSVEIIRGLRDRGRGYE